MVQDVCSGCSKEMEQKSDFACRECQLWPLCGNCVLQTHLDCKPIRVRANFQKQIDLIGPWLLHVGSVMEATIRDKSKRIQAVLIEGRPLLQQPLCNSDPIFYSILERKLINDASHCCQEFETGLGAYEKIKKLFLGMSRFLDGEPMLEDMPFSSVVFYNSWADDLENASNEFDKLASAQMEKRVENVENLKRFINLALVNARTRAVSGSASEKEPEREAQRRRYQSFNATDFSF